jgi:phosphatidyl-myo-inositol dimannoside synthase
VRLAILSSDFPPLSGGIASLARDVARACSAEASVTVLAPSLRGAAGFDDREPYRVIRIGGPSITREARAIRILLQLHRTAGIDLIISTAWIPPGLVACLVSRLRGIPYVVWAHGSEIIDDWRTPRRLVKSGLRVLKKPILGFAAGIVANSRYTRGLVAAQGVARCTIHVISPAVDTNRFRPAVPPGSAKRLRKGAKHCLLTVARLDAHKGHRLVLRALAHHLRDMSGIRYLIVGTGPEEHSLRRLVASLGLDQIVDFLGFVPDGDLPDIYRVADLFVMPSAFLPGRWDLIEGFGIAYAEASASGKPVIAGRSGGTEDAVQDGVTGILVDPDDAAALASAIRELLSNRPLTDRLGQSGRDWVSRELSLPRLRERVFTLADSILVAARQDRAGVRIEEAAQSANGGKTTDRAVGVSVGDTRHAHIE